ncbi:Activating signal cointegrator 1 complex subunit 3, partial [Globisporangium splendens]
MPSPPSLLDALRGGFPTRGAAMKPLKSNKQHADARPASPPSFASAPSGPNSAIADLECMYPFHDPFLLHGGIAGEEGDIWGISNSHHERDLLRVLCVDHADLQEANEREAALGAVGAVVTKKTQKGVSASGKSKTNTTMEAAEKLLQECAKHTSSSAGGFFTTMELAEMILQTMQDNPNDPDMVQTQLFGLVGVEGMDLIAFAIQNQAEFAKNVKRQTLRDVEKQQELAEKFAAAGGAGARPAVASSFSIQTASEQLFLKQQRKANRKARAQGGGAHDDSDDEQNWLEAAGYDPEVLRLQREFAQEEMRNQSTSLLQREFGQLQGGYDTSGAAGQLTSAGMLTLPASTKRTYFKGYEHVFIPAHAKKSLHQNEKLVPISDLEDFAQTAFRGMTHLNRLQSKLFRTAYHTNQNLLVCAPTGAGKTNVAMLTILQEVRSQMQRHKTLANMKIIYVAPMKALAQEVVTKFGQRLSSLKLKVAELTGDMQLTKKEIEQTHVIVTTPEKWDVITRKSSTQQALLSQVKLLIIDEVHLLADERGPVIETIVARTLRRVESTQSMIRIVGLSATLPNYVDVASFLRVYVPAGDARMQNAATNGGNGGLFFFDSTYRPVPLDQTFIGISTNANLKEALGLSAVALSTTPATDDDAAKLEKKMGAASNMSRQNQVKLMMNKLALAHCLKQVEHGEQVMVFVHSRKETAATMHAIVELAQGDEEESGTIEKFLPPSELQMPLSLVERVQKSRNKELKELLTHGLGIHHAGMLRSDRNLSEELFERGFIRVLCCTATLAWGVNLPAHSVLIKGTQVYNSDKGGMTNLSMLDVMQIFGRAGRPQYDTSGDAVLMTTHDQLPHYLRLLTTGIPMESALIKALPDHLNAEIVSGTVSNLDEACEWLSYTYLYVRMKKNPLAYGMKIEDVQGDPLLIERRKQLLMDAAEKLASCRMIKILREKTRLDQPGEGKIAFAVTSMGRVASHFYIQHTSIETFNELLDGKAGNHGSHDDGDDLPWEKVLLILCSSNEFEQMKSREDEMSELEKLAKKFCRFDVLGGGLESYQGKTNVLLQSLIGRARVSSFTLISDTNYVAQNASRVCRALFEICLKKNSARKAEKFLQLSNCIDQKVWWDQCLLLQLPNVPMDVVGQVEAQQLDLYEALADPNKYNLSAKVKKWVTSLPFIDVDAVQMQPFGGNMLKLTFSLLPLFPEWKDMAFGGKTMSSWVWVEDATTGYIYHSEYFVLHQSRFMGWKEGTQTLDMECYLPVFVSQTQKEVNYVIRILSDRFVGIESYYEVSYTPDDNQMQKSKKEKDEMYTNLLRLHPQPLSSLQNPVYEAIYASKFRFFNPIQTQTFHQLYHQDDNVLICAPTGSGKTMCAELAILRVWNKNRTANVESGAIDHKQSAFSRSLIVYIAPLKALAREKVTEWKARFEHNPQLRKKVVEVTGDTVVNVDYILNTADIVITTPEKWDLLTRNVAFGRKLMDKIALVIIDEVHLVGDAPRGAVLEVLISRLRRFSRSVQSNKEGIRLLGLSTALANASDVGQWLGITREHRNQIYNFRASVRPVPMEVHIQGFPERHYVARMAAMNKPTFMAIKAHSPEKPVLIFVSSKAQTKMTALDLISFCVSHGGDEQPGTGNGGAKRFLKMDEAVMDAILSDGHSVQDDNLRHTLNFGIGLHHAGLPRKDRELVEKLFRDRLIQVVISTSTLAWGVNLPAHLVIIKGTEYFQNGRYQSYPLSDLLQMIGRAGRPLLDDKGVACVLVEESKKNMIQRFLYEPLAIESCLTNHLANHVNAEIASGLLKTKKDVLEYLSWSLLFQRVMKNPSFYGIGVDGTRDVESFFQQLVLTNLQQLEASQCIVINATDSSIQPTFLGKIAAALYVDVKTVSNMLTSIKAIISCAGKASKKKDPADVICQIMAVICESSIEIRETIPLRHNEIQSLLITELCNKVKYSPMTNLFKSTPKKQKTLLETHGSELKSFVLLQMHFMRMGMPSSDFGNDLRTLLDQMPRLLGAVIDICAFLKQTELVFAGVRLSQAMVQAKWPVLEEAGAEADDIFSQLPHVSAHVLKVLRDDLKLSSFAELQEALLQKQKKTELTNALTKSMSKQRNNNNSTGLSKNQLNEFLRVAEAIPRLQVTAQVKQRQQKSVVSVELVGLNANVSTLACAKRFQKPKPYGFYVILASQKSSKTANSEKEPDNEPDSSMKFLQMKHVATKQRAEVTFPLSAPSLDDQYVVCVLSDAIAGIDVTQQVQR